jgi:hypothetical protein
MLMQVDAALVKERGVTFAVVVVKSYVLTSQRRDQIAARYADHWSGVPVVLMAQDTRGVPKYYGRHDIVDFLASIPVRALPWRKWSLS